MRVRSFSLDQPTHLDYCKASCVHSSSLISCWFFPPLPDFSLYMLQVILPSWAVAFSMQPPSLAAARTAWKHETWTTEAHRSGDVNMKVFSHTALPWGSRRWVVEAQSEPELCDTHTTPSPFRNVMTLILSWNEASSLEHRLLKAIVGPSFQPVSYDSGQFNGRKSSFLRETGDRCDMSRWQSVWNAVVFLGWANRWMSSVWCQVLSQCELLKPLP